MTVSNGRDRPSQVRNVPDFSTAGATGRTTSAITSHADVVLPVAPAVEKSGAFLTWEGRSRPFETVLSTNAMPDHRVLSVLADALGVSLGTDSLAAVRSELERLGRWAGDRAAAPDVSPAHRPSRSS